MIVSASCKNGAKVEFKDHLMNNPQKTFNTQTSRINDDYIKSLQSFTADFMNVAYEGDNTIFSPISIATCFSMLLDGTKNNSKTELDNLLHYSDAFNHLDEIKNMLLATAIDRVDPESNKQVAYLDINQSFFVHNRYKDFIREDYLKTLEDYYFAEAYQGVLESNEMHDLLAKWINNKTNNFFNLKGDDFKDLEGILWLVNSIYTKANWFEPFVEYTGSDTNFTSIDGTIKTVKYICNYLEYATIYQNDDYMIATIGLKGGLYFRILLPKDINKTNDIFNSKEAYLNLLSPKDSGLEKVNAHLHVKIPEFKYVQNYDLIPFLKKLGVNDIFNPAAADLTGISDRAKDDGLHVGGAIHAAGIDVNKDGIEAAAYTIIMVAESAIGEELPEINLNVDHPFMYTLGFSNDLPLFMGIENNL